MKKRDYGYFGKGLTGYAQYRTAFKRIHKQNAHQNPQHHAIPTNYKQQTKEQAHVNDDAISSSSNFSNLPAQEKPKNTSSVPSIEEFVKETKNTTPSQKSDEITTAQLILWIILGALGFGVAIGAVIGVIMLLMSCGAIGIIILFFAAIIACNMFFSKH